MKQIELRGTLEFKWVFLTFTMLMLIRREMMMRKRVLMIIMRIMMGHITMGHIMTAGEMILTMAEGQVLDLAGVGEQQVVVVTDVDMTIAPMAMTKEVGTVKVEEEVVSMAVIITNLARIVQTTPVRIELIIGPREDIRKIIFYP